MDAIFSYFGRINFARIITQAEELQKTRIDKMINHLSMQWIINEGDKKF